MNDFIGMLGPRPGERCAGAFRAKLSCAVSLLLAAGPALADESAGERLFREGRALMLEGRFEEACRKMDESQKLEPHTGTLLNLAACHEKQGKVATAWIEYQKGLTAARAEGQADKERLASQRIEVLEPRLPWLTVSIRSPSAEATLVLDGAPLPKMEWGKELPVDPGEHVVAGNVTGRPPFEERFSLREGERRIVSMAWPDDPVPTAVPSNTLVVEPPAEPARPPVAPAKPEQQGRFRFDVGFFAAYLQVNAQKPWVWNPASVPVQGAAGQPSTCAREVCSYAISASDQGAAAIGARLFVGYAFSEAIVAGAFGFVGPRIGGSGDSGNVHAVGPAVSVHASRAVSFGAAALFGGVDVTVTSGIVVGPSGSKVGPYPLEASFQAGGMSLMLDVELLRLPRGALDANIFPFFLLGAGGTAWSLPVAVSYRFQ